MIVLYISALVFGLAMLFILMYSLAQAHLLLHFIRTRHSSNPPKAFSQNQALPKVTVQLPIFNERYVVDRLLEAVFALNYPSDKLQIQVLDDSTDLTRSEERRVVKACT